MRDWNFVLIGKAVLDDLSNLGAPLPVLVDVPLCDARQVMLLIESDIQLIGDICEQRPPIRVTGPLRQTGPNEHGGGPLFKPLGIFLDEFLPFHLFLCKRCVNEQLGLSCDIMLRCRRKLQRWPWKTPDVTFNRQLTFDDQRRPGWTQSEAA